MNLKMKNEISQPNQADGGAKGGSKLSNHQPGAHMCTTLIASIYMLEMLTKRKHIELTTLVWKEKYFADKNVLNSE